MSRSIFHNLNRLVLACAERAEADTALVRAKTRADSEVAEGIGSFARLLEEYLPHVLRRFCPETVPPGGCCSAVPNPDAGADTGGET